MSYYLGVDVGTGSARAALLSHSGELLCVSSELIGFVRPPSADPTLPVVPPRAAPSRPTRRSPIATRRTTGSLSSRRPTSGRPSARPRTTSYATRASTGRRSRASALTQRARSSSPTWTAGRPKSQRAPTSDWPRVATSARTTRSSSGLVGGPAEGLARRLEVLTTSHLRRADHRAEDEAKLINESGSVVLDYVGGTMSVSARCCRIAA